MPGKTRMYVRASLSNTFNAVIIDWPVFSATRIIAMDNSFWVKAYTPWRAASCPLPDGSLPAAADHEDSRSTLCSDGLDTPDPGPFRRRPKRVFSWNDIEVVPSGR